MNVFSSKLSSDNRKSKTVKIPPNVFARADQVMRL